MSLIVRVASRSHSTIDEMTQLLSDTRYDVQPRRMVNGDRDPLLGADTLPDALIFQLSVNYAEELSALSSRPKESSRPLIVIGDGSDPGVMRLAMQAGARDFLVEPVSRSELLEALDRVEIEHVDDRPDSHRTISFVNAKGGCGASFLAANAAHMLCEATNASTVLVDLDVQFATIPQYLDLQPTRGLLEALAAVDDLDDIAVKAYLIEHASGLQVLTSVDRAMESCDDVARRFEVLSELLKLNHQCTVIDVPRYLDGLGAAALMASDEIVLVVQQNLPAVRDAMRLLQVLREDLSIPGDRLTVCVNRYRRESTIELSDIRRTLNIESTIEIPNHFRSVSESIDAGVPILEYARQSPVTKALFPVARRWGGSDLLSQQSFIARKLAGFLRT